MMATRWQPSFLTWRRTIGNGITRILADAGYRGHNAPLSYSSRSSPPARTPHDARHQARDAPPLRRRTREGHIKNGHRMDRNYLAGSQGDAINAVLSATAITSAPAQLAKASSVPDCQPDPAAIIQCTKTSNRMKADCSRRRYPCPEISRLKESGPGFLLAGLQCVADFGQQLLGRGRPRGGGGGSAFFIRFDTLTSWNRMKAMIRTLITMVMTAP